MWFEAKELLAKELKFFKMASSYLSAEGTRKLLAFISTIFAGNISKSYLEGVGLANTLINILVMSLSQGYARIFHTFGPQVYGSAEPGELTTCLMKCLLQGVMLHLFLLGPFLNLVYLIDMLPNSGVYPTLDTGDSSGVQDFRDIAVEYLRLTVPAEFLDYACVAVSTYFIIQGQKKFVYLVSLIMAASHFLANYILVSVLELGVEGLGLAANTGRFVALTVSFGICIYNIKRGSFPWNGITIEALLGWKPMIKLGLSGALFVFLKLLLLEISTFCSQFVSLNTLSVAVILIQIHSVFKSLAIASALTSSNIIGEALAERNVSNVKHYMMLTLINVSLEVVIGSAICYFWRGSLIRIFTHDQEVVELFCKVFWLACLFFVFSHLQMAVNQGILTAFGEQAYTARNVIWSCLLVGLPIVISTIFLTDLGLIGILLGLTITKFLLFITGLIKLWRTDISREIEKSRQRVAKSYGSLETGQTNATLNDPAEELERTDKVTVSEGCVQDTHPGKFSDKRELLNTEDTPTRSADGEEIRREVKTVLSLFMLSIVLFITLGGISFMRDF